MNEILFLTLAAAISGITEWDEMEEFGRYKLDWLRKFFEYEHGIPSHDTLNRLYSSLDPSQFCDSFTEWVGELRTHYQNEVIAIDGKTIKGTDPKCKGMEGIYYVSAYAAENELVLSQAITQEKSNEITAVPKLLDAIDCKGLSSLLMP